jgi:hypothetical protein
MERNERYTDELLKKLIGRAPLDQPSDSFVDKVMSGILPMPETARQKKPFFLMVRASIPWVLLSAFFILFLVSSDVPYLSSLPGGAYLRETLWPSIVSMFSGFSRLVPERPASFVLPVVVAGVLLFGLERLLSRKMSAKHHAS